MSHVMYGGKMGLRILLLLILCSFIEAKEKKSELEKIFTRIYERATWGKNEKGVGFSGGGSLLKNAEPYIDFLEDFIKINGIRTVVDAGCGDWEFSKYVDWSEVQYIGYDIVASVIENNRKSYIAPNIQFVHANFLEVELPSADLLVCKHVLQHLSVKDIRKMVKQLPKFKYCLITNQVEKETLSSDNLDIYSGGSRKLDLSKPPYSLQGENVFHYDDTCGTHQVFLIRGGI